MAVRSLVRCFFYFVCSEICPYTRIVMQIKMLVKPKYRASSSANAKEWCDGNDGGLDVISHAAKADADLVLSSENSTFSGIRASLAKTTAHSIDAGTSAKHQRRENCKWQQRETNEKSRRSPNFPTDEMHNEHNLFNFRCRQRRNNIDSSGKRLCRTIIAHTARYDWNQSLQITLANRLPGNCAMAFNNSTKSFPPIFN